MRVVPRLDLPLRLERAAGEPLHRQLAEALRRAVLEGHLAAGARLPSTRQAAEEVGVARATVLAAYEQLVGEGYLEARHGSGTRVSPHVVPPPRQLRPPRAGPEPDEHRQPVDLRPGRPDTSRVVDPAWREAWRRAAASVPSGEPPAQGLPALRAEVASHLRAARGVDADADAVFVTAGTSEALALVALALGPGTVVVEDPGYPSARRCLARLGADLLPVPVDADGLRVDLLPGAGDGDGGGDGDADAVRAVLVTPSHQYPLGGVLPLSRRLALLAWAREHGAVVVEDDYDSEFRYGAAPLPALVGLDPERVVHVGTFSKVLSPWLRTGYLLVPPGLRPAFDAVRHDLGTPVSGVQQQALSAYLSSGALRRHTARSRRDYGHRRAHLLRRLEAAPQLGTIATSAGLHTVITLPAGTDAAAVVRAVADRGYLLADLAEYVADRAPDRGARPAAVVLGYADATLADLDGVVDALAAAC